MEGITIVQAPDSGGYDKLLVDAGEMSSARNVFDEMPEPGFVSRNVLISGILLMGWTIMFPKLFRTMHQLLLLELRRLMPEDLRAFTSTIMSSMLWHLTRRSKLIELSLGKLIRQLVCYLRFSLCYQ